MKKVLFGLLALSAVSFAAQGDTYVTGRFGGDIGAKYDDFSYQGVDLVSDDTSGFGGEIALEGYRSLTNNFDLGLGIAYQFHAERDDQNLYHTNTGEKVGTAEGVDYKSVPVYVTAKYNFNINSDIKPYVKANLGYSFNFDSSDYKQKASTGETYKLSTDTDNGLYYALGGGVEYHNFTVDLMYAVNKAESEAETEGFDFKKDNDYERFVLSVGYKFNI